MTSAHPLRHADGAKEKLLTLLAISACAMFAFSAPLFPDANRYAKTLIGALTLTALARGERDRELFPLFVFFLISLGLEVTSWLASFQAAQFHFMPDSLPRIEGVGKWFWFLLLAFWLRKKPWAPGLFWTFAALALVVTPWILGDGVKEIGRALAGYRIDAGTRNAQHAAMYAGVALIGGICLIIDGSTRSDKRVLFICAGTALTTTALFYLYGTQTRAIWLGSLFAIAVILVSFSLLTPTLADRRIKKKYIIMTVSLVVLVGMLAAMQTPMSSKIERETGTVSLALQGKFSEIPLDSSGVRIRSWYYALPWIAQSPVFGWGPDGSKLIMQESDAIPAPLKSRFGHLHNTYMDLLAQYGVAGLAFYLGLLAWLATRLIQAHKNNAISPSVFLFGTGFLAYWLVINIFESYMFYDSGKYAFSAVLAGTLSLTLKPRQSATAQEFRQEYA